MMRLSAAVSLETILQPLLSLFEFWDDEYPNVNGALERPLDPATQNRLAGAIDAVIVTQ
jgi:hypothetical protein